MSIERIDTLLGQLSESWLDTLEERYPSKPRHPYRLSLGFRSKMWWVCQKADWFFSHENNTPFLDTWTYRHWTRRSVAVLLAAVLSVSVAIACVVQFFQMRREEYEKYSTIYYEKIADGFVPGEFVCYTLGYVPEGFELEQEVTIGEFHEEKYLNNKNNGNDLVVVFRQIRIDQATLDIDTEKVKPVEISLNKKQKAWYLGNATNKVVYWDNGEYFFSISGHLSKDELVNVANSITIK